MSLEEEDRAGEHGVMECIGLEESERSVGRGAVVAFS